VVEVVGDEGFVADEEEERELFQNGDLGDFLVGDDLGTNTTLASVSPS
jgi:hypothetical protein